MLTNGCIFGQDTNLPDEFGPHPWTATIKLVGEDGNPIVGADVAVQYNIVPVPTDPNQPKYGEIKGLSDTNGLFGASHTDNSLGLAITVDKSGYYTTHTGHQFYFNEKNRHPSFTLLLKQIGKPIAMYAKKAQIEIPEIDNPIGFDLIIGDWIAPYGKGVQGDFILQVHRRWVSRNDFDSTLTLSFPNSSDGLIPNTVPLTEGGELRLSANAPDKGYISELSESLSHTPTIGWKKDENKEQNYYFRVRTILNSQGEVTSALYGKIYGDFTLDPINSKTTWILFTYYLNPTPNSRNVEFDPKQNLLGGLQPIEQVSAP